MTAYFVQEVPHGIRVHMTVTRTFTYRVLRIRKSKREKLEAMLRPLIGLRKEAIVVCRRAYEGGKKSS